jgi:hypothetical protein
VEGARIALRASGSLVAITAALKDAFGQAVLSVPIGGPASGASGAGLAVAAAYKANLAPAAPTSLNVPPEPPATKEFKLHNSIWSDVEALFSQCLPFGQKWGVSFPTQVRKLFQLLDGFDGWVLFNLQPGGSLRASQAQLAMGSWAMLLTLTARVYLADFLCSFARLALPLDRLYEEGNAGSLGNVSIDSDPNSRDGKVQTKSIYDAYTAVGLLELLTSSMPHLDARLGDGYIQASGALRSFGSLDPFDAFWKGAQAVTHASMMKELRLIEVSPVMRFPYSLPSGAKSSPAPLSMTLNQLRSRMLQHALPPPVRSPPPKPKEGSAKKGNRKPPPPDAAPWDECGHFISHLKLSAAKKLAMILATSSTAPTAALEPNAPYVSVGGGSERWGGNQWPHLEHRDGFTFDVSNRSKYLPWPVNKVPDPAAGGGGKGKKKPQDLPIVGVPEPPLSANSYLPLLDKVLKEASLKSKYAELAANILGGQEWENLTLDLEVFAGTPVLLGEDGEPDADLLIPNLIGQVALTLSGVRKWIYASYYERFFALRTVAALFNDADWLALLKDQTALILPLIQSASFIWAPRDHHDHWHVVFVSNSITNASSLGPDAFKVDKTELAAYLNIWKALGVDLGDFRDQLEQTGVAHAELFTAAATERADILELLNKFYPRGGAKGSAIATSKDQRDAFVAVLATSISGTSYDDVASLKEKKYKKWAEESSLATSYAAPRAVSPKGWTFWKSDDDEDRGPLMPADEAAVWDDE